MHVKFRFTTRCFSKSDEVIWKNGVQPQMRLRLYAVLLQGEAATNNIAVV